MERVIDQPTPEQHLLERILSRENILVKSQRAGDRVMEGMKTFLTHKLKLTVNETKSAVDRTSKIDFLGFIFSGTRIIRSDKAYKEFR